MSNWRPGGTSPNRKFVRGSETVWRHYHGRLREIVTRDWFSEAPDADEYALDVEERMVTVAKMREAARQSLRDECANLVRLGNVGPYIIPV